MYGPFWAQVQPLCLISLFYLYLMVDLFAFFLDFDLIRCSIFICSVQLVYLQPFDREQTAQIVKLSNQ